MPRAALNQAVAHPTALSGESRLPTAPTCTPREVHSGNLQTANHVTSSLWGIILPQDGRLSMPVMHML